MKFTPKSEDEIQNTLLLAEGCYTFEVVSAQEKISKAGKEMIELKLKIDDGQSNPRVIFDYLLEAMQFKLRHFAKATNLLDKYELGELKAEDCLGKVGNVEITIQPGQQKPEGGSYPPKNVVKDYIAGFVPPGKQLLDDEIPF